ncbi:endospore germination permease [Filibacter tadaridae]|uniref:Spore germination protein YndE n=1 Tax=Filibacter tadaridae TaxID=2483811 RepID=A0A3P5X1Y5_9BACL|nr:endospore germination permease [Filibacter tadaridae]VDC28130.1 Spore germination protein YndE [Filibacter tadaridae]
MQNVKINSSQFLILVILFTVGTSILTIPSALAADTDQDAWITVIIGTGIGLLVIWLYTTIALWFPSLTYVQLNEKVFGKWVGKVLSLLVIIMAFLYTASLLYYSGTFLNIHVMPNTPLVALNILMMGIIVMGVRLGLETIARSAEILFFVFLILFLSLVVLIAPGIQIENIQPVFEAEAKKIIKSSIFYVAVASSNAVVLLMVFPAFINKVKHAKKSFIIGNLIGGIVIIIVTFLCISVLGPEKTAREIYASYELTKRINVGDFIQRIEAVSSTLWIISVYFKAVLYFYASVLGIAQLLNIKDYRPLTLPLGMIAVFLSIIIYPSISYQVNWDETTGTYFSLFVGVVLPLLLAVVYGVRKKSLKKDSGSS